MNPNDVVLTGPPRSGTTLTCELLNEAADTIALDEPMDDGPWVGRKASAKAPRRIARILNRRASDKGVIADERFPDLVQRFFDDVRASVHEGKGALTLNYDGRIIGEKFPDKKDEAGLRQVVTTRSLMRVDKPLSEDFVLVVKQISGFAAMLDLLSARFRCYAIVRNPLSTLSSWQTVNVPIKDGHIPRGEHVDDALRQELATTPSAIDRQFIILRWFYDRFHRLLPEGSVIRYEDIIATGGRALSPISASAADLERPLDNRNRASVYDRGSMKELGERLLSERGPWWEYYTPDSVRAVMNDGDRPEA